MGSVSDKALPFIASYSLKGHYSAFTQEWIRHLIKQYFSFLLRLVLCSV